MNDQELDQLVAQYADLLQAAIDQNGIYPGPAWIVKEDGKREIMALAMPASEAVQAAINRTRQAEGWQVLLAGYDVNCAPGQGTTLDSAWILLCAQRGREPRVGVIEYSYNEGAPISRPVNWENRFWQGQMERLGVLQKLRRLTGLPVM